MNASEIMEWVGLGRRKHSIKFWGDMFSDLDSEMLFLLRPFAVCEITLCTLLFARCQHYNTDDFSDEPDFKYSLTLQTKMQWKFEHYECPLVEYCYSVIKKRIEKLHHGISELVSVLLLSGCTWSIIVCLADYLAGYCSTLCGHFGLRLARSGISLGLQVSLLLVVNLFGNHR